MIDVVFINGTVGAGKTSTGEALSALVTQAGCPHAFIDTDAVRRLSPKPPGDRFQHELQLRNLRDLAANYRDAGAERLILAGVIEDRHEIPRYTETLKATGLFLCRLVADPTVIDQRLSARHHDDPAELDWHLRRNRELAEILEAVALDDLIIDATSDTPCDIAMAIKAAVNW
ncbi:MAG: hypothetical protein EPN48_13150 [Microbacteriaceae bacterium]|nr:MAG: hypothetical protein EPN48_13150 [Microbacteriaceae bacterium]